MPDLDDTVYFRVVASLELERETCRRYHGLLEAQRAAVGAGDFAAVLELADEVADVQDELARLKPLCAELRSADSEHHVGPRAKTVRGLVEALIEENLAIEGEIRLLTDALATSTSPGTWTQVPSAPADTR